MATLRYEAQTKTLQDIINLYKDDHLNLEPAFQRASVWNDRDRAHLVDSILRGYPLPAVFFRRRTNDSGYLIYDVIDGKQRIESILRFCGEVRGGRFPAKTLLPGNEYAEWIDWPALKRHQLQHLIFGYKVNVIEVEGELTDVIDLFVRINSTGKALTRQERRHARYYNSTFLAKAAKLAGKYETYLVRNKILSPSQIVRMKHVELFCELMLSAHTQDVLNKKAALDKVMASSDITDRQILRSAEATTRAIGRLKRILPDIAQTRFRQLADFYTIVVLLQAFEREGCALTDRRSKRLAHDLLFEFSSGVDSVKEKQKKIQGVRASEELYRQYLMTVLEGTDEVNNRRHRIQILRGVLASLFARKDADRLFSPEQRRILWNSGEERRCSYCKKRLSWDDFTIDHIRPHSKGGRTALDNAALMCRKHNSMKGNRRLRVAA